jgi:hypothetical protein
MGVDPGASPDRSRKAGIASTPFSGPRAWVRVLDHLTLALFLSSDAEMRSLPHVVTRADRCLLLDVLAVGEDRLDYAVVLPPCRVILEVEEPSR